MEEPGENITGNSKHYLPLLSPERLKIFERFALGEKCYWISLADGEKEEVETEEEELLSSPEMG